ncbi:unnamed protein product [Cylicocyclus nassatus]|uniref:Uncharacterized protein n=1 Tax=Cylicocyclus nassatus TaxID=53992 RepID=A0AA36DR05_CYLNA|nr:unnamed protein product [Cylicocyclus nassatus]
MESKRSSATPRNQFSLAQSPILLLYFCMRFQITLYACHMRFFIAVPSFYSSYKAYCRHCYVPLYYAFHNFDVV